MTSRFDNKCWASCGRAARSSTAGRREDRSRLVSNSCVQRQATEERTIAPIAALAATAALVCFDVLREAEWFGDDGVTFEFPPRWR
jgi:hypothetical protein